jgi:hypothetical protein
LTGAAREAGGVRREKGKEGKGEAGADLSGGRGSGTLVSFWKTSLAVRMGPEQVHAVVHAVAPACGAAVASLRNS